MDEIEFKKYSAEEYLSDEFREGFHHEGEAGMIFPPQDAYLEANGERLIVGEIYSEYDCKLCYRLNKEGFWYLSNGDGSYQYGGSLTKFVESWTKGLANRFGSS